MSALPLDPQTLGTSLILSSTLMGSTFLAFKLKDFLAEKPDPKLTYTPLTQFNNLQQQLKHHEKDSINNIHNLRKEIKTDLTQLHNSMLQCHQDVAALTGQIPFIHQRLSELTAKTDHLFTPQKQNTLNP